MDRSARHCSSPWDDHARLGLLAFDNAADLVVVVDDERRIGTINPAVEALTGRSRDQVCGEHLSVLLAPHAVEAGLAAIERAAAGELDEVDVALAGRQGPADLEGGWVTVGMTVAPLFLDGEVAGLVLNGRDAEERHRLQHDLEQLATSFRALADASEVGIYRFAFHPQLRVEYVNRALEDTIGLSRDELSRDPSLLIDRLDPDVRQRFLDNRRGEDPPIWPIEFEWPRPDGEVVVVSVEEVSVRDPEGRLVAVLGVGRDVTRERRREASIVRALQHERQAAEGLRQVDQLRRLFLQAVSHELRTPLTTVLGFASTLSTRGGELAAGQVQTLASRILDQGRRIERLLDDLLDVERLTRGVLDLAVEEHDLAEVVGRVLRDLDEPGVAADLATVVVPIDRSKLERIVVNLVANARRHAGPEAKVRVRVGEHEVGARVVVEDDGPGVPDELKARVFEPFEQGPASRELPSPGTGIGLTLVAEFVRLHGGRVWVEDADGGGARFLVELPRDPVPPPPWQPPA